MKKLTKTFALFLGIIVLFVSFSVSQSRRDRRDQPEKLLEYAGVKPGMTIGEAGAGSGYFTFFLSRRVGDRGKIYANDIDEDSLQALKNRCRREGVENIETVVGEIADPCFPVSDLEMVTMLYAFHDFTEKEQWLRNVKKYMKDDASLVIFDGQDAHTGLNKEVVSNIAGKTGFELLKHEHLHNGIWVYVLNIRNSLPQ
ncbi:MAG: methyltransferase domain-containing protein [Candidatus Aminicenantes bacterium]|nr:methyltransferase domain-containing protein [Candidatus Aminicenantes bacterium]